MHTVDGRKYTALLLTYSPRIIGNEHEAQRIRTIVASLSSLPYLSDAQAAILPLLMLLVRDYDTRIETYGNSTL